MAYGNDNIMGMGRTIWTAFTTTESLALSGGARAVLLRATAACWVKAGTGAQTVVKPTDGAAVNDGTFFLPANQDRIINVSGTDAAPWYVGVLQDSSGGNLYITELLEL